MSRRGLQAERAGVPSGRGAVREEDFGQGQDRTLKKVHSQEEVLTTSAHLWHDRGGVGGGGELT